MSKGRCSSVSRFRVCSRPAEHSIRSLFFIIRHSAFDILRFSSASTHCGRRTTDSVLQSTKVLRISMFTDAQARLPDVHRGPRSLGSPLPGYCRQGRGSRVSDLLAASRRLVLSSLHTAGSDFSIAGYPGQARQKLHDQLRALHVAAHPSRDRHFV